MAKWALDVGLIKIMFWNKIKSMRQQGVLLRITYQPTTFLHHTVPITQPLLKVLDQLGEVIDKILKIEKRKKRWKKGWSTMVALNWLLKY